MIALIIAVGFLWIFMFIVNLRIDKLEQRVKELEDGAQ